MHFARYNWIFSLLFVPGLLAIVLLALFIQPITGDLTRLGGYLEEQFGWNDPQYGYTQPAFRMATGLDDYDKYYDVVVVGDSFSLFEQSGWQNVLHEKTGLSIISFAYPAGFAPSGFNLDILLTSREFREHPPRYLVYESVERKMVAHLKRYANPAMDYKQLSEQKYPARNITMSSIVLETLQLERMPSYGMEQRFQDAGSYVVKSIRRVLGDLGKTRIYPLASKELFSSDRSDLLLVTDEDVLKQPITEIDGLQVSTGLRNIEKLVEQNGITQFMLLIFPDKLSTYTPYLQRPETATQNYIPVLAKYYDFPRVDSVFQKALKDGVKDLYLPNDTHTGYMGHRLAAQELTRFYFSPKDSNDQ